MKVAVVGLGRVGLPLALFLESLGMKVIGVDRDVSLIAKLRQRVMPFHEEGCDALISESAIEFTESAQQVREADYIVITVGTPLYNHIEADLASVRAVCTELIPVLRPGQTIILRSTVAPETTLYIRRFLEMRTGLACVAAPVEQTLLDMQASERFAPQRQRARSEPRFLGARLRSSAGSRRASIRPKPRRPSTRRSRRWRARASGAQRLRARLERPF